MCAAAKAAVPTIGDQAAQLSVSNATRQMALALAELRTCATNTEQVSITSLLSLYRIAYTSTIGSIQPLPYS